MIALTIDKIDGFVAKSQRKGVDVRTEGWNLIFHNPHPKAIRSVKGRFSRSTERWGFETTVAPNEAGMWLVDYKLARGNKIATG